MPWPGFSRSFVMEVEGLPQEQRDRRCCSADQLTGVQPRAPGCFDKARALGVLSIDEQNTRIAQSSRTRTDAD
jgi:hypothetical protein